MSATGFGTEASPCTAGAAARLMVPCIVRCCRRLELSSHRETHVQLLKTKRHGPSRRGKVLFGRDSTRFADAFEVRPASSATAFPPRSMATLFAVSAVARPALRRTSAQRSVPAGAAAGATSGGRHAKSDDSEQRQQCFSSARTPGRPCISFQAQRSRQAAVCNSNNMVVASAAAEEPKSEKGETMCALQVSFR